MVGCSWTAVLRLRSASVMKTGFAGRKGEILLPCRLPLMPIMLFSAFRSCGK